MRTRVKKYPYKITRHKLNTFFFFDSIYIEFHFIFNSLKLNENKPNHEKIILRTFNLEK